MSNFILTLKLKTEKYQEDLLDKKLENSRNIYNACLGSLYKRYNYMINSLEYIDTISMKKGKYRNKSFNELNKKYGLTEYSLHKYVKYMGKKFKIDAQTTQKIATRCFKAFQRLILHQCDKVYFKKYGEMNSIEGKTNKQGIRFKDNTLIVGKMKIPVLIKNNDYYAKEALTNKIKYCRIVRKFIRSKNVYYIQLIMEGLPPFKNIDVIGDVGIDIGTQTVAIVSEKEVKLLELAPEVENIENVKCELMRKMDRQRRRANPNNFNKDGTIRKQGNKKVIWIKSKRYINNQNRLKELYRKQSDIRKQSHERLSNYILSLGNRVTVESMNFKGLQAKAKKTTVNKKTGKFNKKKRFGKSLANKAPSMFLMILDNKLKYRNSELLKINTYKVKASQYNHFTDEYTKKSLSDRWNYFDTIKIQRDLYSAFLIMNVDDIKLEKVNRDLCIKRFDNFKELHDVEINRIKTCKNKRISSTGL